jgi:sugar-specific transcriptional regulator TrmB
MMPRLISIGLIEETVDRPKRYCATPLRWAITQLREQVLCKYRELEQDAIRLIPDLEQIQARVGTVEDRQVRVISGLENMLRDFQVELDAAEKEVVICARHGSSSRIHTFMKNILPMLKSKNLRARVILDVDKDNVGYARWLSSVFEIRHHHPVHAHIHVVDGRTAALGLTSARSPT